MRRRTLALVAGLLVSAGLVGAPTAAVAAATALTATIPVGTSPTEVATNPYTSTVYVTNQASGTVSVISG